MRVNLATFSTRQRTHVNLILARFRTVLFVNQDAISVTLAKLATTSRTMPVSIPRAMTRNAKYVPRLVLTCAIYAPKITS